MKDKRYDSVGRLIRANQIKTFDEILIVIPKTRLARDLKINPERFNRLLENVEFFVMKDLFKLADLCEVDSIAVLQLVNNQYMNRKGRNKKATRT